MRGGMCLCNYGGNSRCPIHQGEQEAREQMTAEQFHRKIWRERTMRLSDSSRDMYMEMEAYAAHITRDRERERDEAITRFDYLHTDFVAVVEERNNHREALRKWRGQLLDAWAKDHRATMTALLEMGPDALGTTEEK